jgi:hypothetical protein
MSADCIIELPAIPVMYVAGEKGRPISEQAPGQGFYGTIVDGEYRACVAQEPGDEGLALARWILPGGKYHRVRLADWEAHRDRIGPTAADLRLRPDHDPTRFVIERYRSRRELQILAPVR